MVNRTQLKHIIRDSGHTYATLGREIGISPQAVSEIVSGRTKGKTARYALAVALGLQVEDVWPDVSSAAHRAPLVPRAEPSSGTTGAALDSSASPHPLRDQDLLSVERIAAVQATGLLGSRGDERLARLMAVAQRSSNATVAVLSLVDGHNQHIVARAGLAPQLRGTYPADVGACPYVVASGAALAVNNLARDERFVNDRLLKDVDAKAFLGVPVRNTQGHVLGALALMDSGPRRWSSKHVEILHDLSLTVSEITSLYDHGGALTRTKRQLDEVRNLFHHLIDQSSDVFWISHPYTSRVEYVSSAFDEVFGWPRERLTEDGALLEMIHPADRARVAAGIARQVLGEHTHEYRVVRQDGSVRWIRSRATPITDEQGEAYRISGIARDVTEEKMTEGFLRDALERFYSTDPPEGGIFWKGDIYGLRWHFKAGAETEARFGPMPDPEHGRSWWEERIHPEDRERVLKTVAEALQLHSGLWQDEYRFADSTRRYHRVRATVYFFRGDPHADPIGIVEVLREA